MDPWQIENLLKSAFVRTKERFLTYLLSLGLSTAIGGGVVLALVILGTPLAALMNATKFSILSIFLGALLAVAGIIAGVYLAAWISLTVTQSLISPKRKGIVETFREVHPWVWGFVGYQCLAGLFLLGLLPLGLITFFLIPILWVAWGSFAAFVYLEERKKGLANLWVSKTLISQRFWGILGREALVFFTLGAVGVLVNLSGPRLLGSVWGCLQIFMTPLIVCFNYEMYRLLPKTATGKTPRGWLIASAAGWLLSLVFLLLSYGAITNLAKNFPLQMDRISFPAEGFSQTNRRIPMKSKIF
ncbi:MAG: hypothetical protein Q8N84_02300 [bacterium]|nr:hypothetical protein [bacterium]